jgi:hypothetical protein
MQNHPQNNASYKVSVRRLEYLPPASFRFVVSHSLFRSIAGQLPFFHKHKKALQYPKGLLTHFAATASNNRSDIGFQFF